MNLDLNDPVAVLLGVSKALAAADIDHAAYGGLALAAYGSPRETKDADLATVGVEPSAVMTALRAAGFDASLSFERMQFGGLLITRFALLGSDAELNVADLIEARSRRFAEASLKRAMEGTLRGRRVRILTPEDFILFKVLSTRERDLEDAATVWRKLRDDLDIGLIDGEATALAAELPDHDVTARLRRCHLKDD